MSATPDSWYSLGELYQAAFALPPSQQRVAFLKEPCDRQRFLVLTSPKAARQVRSVIVNGRALLKKGAAAP